MILGAHESVAGGLELAFERARSHGCSALQIFTRNQRQWRVSDIDDAEARSFGAQAAAHDYPLEQVLVHAGYLINLASPDANLRARSRRALLAEMRRCDRLGLRRLNLHPGSHGGHGEARGLARAISSFNWVLERAGELEVSFVLEVTAGQGNSLGHRFEHMRAIIDGVAAPNRFAVCLDTAHAFASGYDISTRRGYERVMSEFDAVVGLDRLVAFHLNDSMRELGSRIDRHEQIGKGFIGDTAFRCLVGDPRHANALGIVELPEKVVPANLARLRGFERRGPGRE